MNFFQLHWVFLFIISFDHRARSESYYATMIRDWGLKDPIDIMIDKNDTKYICHANGIFKVTENDIRTTVPTATGRCTGLVMDSQGNMFYSNYYSFIIGMTTPSGQTMIFAGSGESVTRDGVGTQAAFKNPLYIAIDRNDNLYVSQLASGPDSAVRKINRNTREVTTISINAGDVVGLDFNPHGDLLIGNGGSYVVRKYTSDGQMLTFAGTDGSKGDVDAVGTEAKFPYIYGLKVHGKSGNIFVSHYNDHMVKRISPDGQVTTILGKNGFWGAVEGLGTNSRIGQPSGMAFDSQGNMFLTVRSYNYISKIFVCPGWSEYSKWDGKCICSKGTFRSNNSSCEYCPEGKYKQEPGDSLDFCIDCPAGNEPNSDRSTCVFCPVGKYRTTNMVKCVTCPENSNCQTSSANCLAGYERTPSTEDKCIQCKPGFFKSTISNDPCNPCPRGSEATADGKACIACTENYHRLSSEYPTCRPCPQENVESCSSFSISCKNDYIYDEISNNCSRCPAGTQFDSNITQCITCSPGTFRYDTSLLKCQACPEGFHCINDTFFSCLPGYQKTSSENACVKCPLGTFKNHTSAHDKCQFCPVGFESNSNRLDCLQCAAGKFRPYDNMESCIACPAGTKCSSDGFTCLSQYEPANTSQGQIPQCKPCDSGKFKRDEGNFNCVSCGPDYYINENTQQCSPCFDGYYLSLEDKSTCLPCGLGRQTNYLRTECSECSQGFYKPTDDVGPCISCPNGATCTAINFECKPGYFQIGAQCIQCPVGQAKSSTGRGPCIRCPVGTQSNKDFSNCEQCPSDTYRPRLELSKCTACPVGSTCNGTYFECLNGWTLSNGQCVKSFDSPSEDDDDSTATLNNRSSSSTGQGMFIYILIVPVAILVIMSVSCFCCWKFYERRQKRMFAQMEFFDARSLKFDRAEDVISSIDGILTSNINTNPVSNAGLGAEETDISRFPVSTVSFNS